MRKLMIKKLSQNNLIISFLSFVVLFFGVKRTYAQCGPALGIPCNPLNSISTLADGIEVVILFLLSLVGLLSLVFLVISGIKYILSAGNEEKMKSAKDGFSSSLQGLVLALMAFTILEIIMGILNG